MFLTPSRNGRGGPGSRGQRSGGRPGREMLSRNRTSAGRTRTERLAFPAFRFECVFAPRRGLSLVAHRQGGWRHASRIPRSALFQVRIATGCLSARLRRGARSGDAKRRTVHSAEVRERAFLPAEPDARSLFGAGGVERLAVDALRYRPCGEGNRPLLSQRAEGRSMHKVLGAMRSA